MKVKSISAGNTGSKDERTMEQFVDSELAKTPLGLLLIALAAETTWSSDYTIDAFLYGDQPGLRITCPASIDYWHLTILAEDKICTIRGVEDAVRAYLHRSGKEIEKLIAPLQQKMHDLYHASLNIDTAKAKAAIVAVFPEAVDAEHLSHISDAYGDGSLCSFVVNNCGRESIFVARETDHEFVGGVARLNRDRIEWWRFNTHQRHELFWRSLARAFAANELKISEDKLRNGIVASKEKPPETWTSDPRYDPYVVERVMFELPGGPQVDVEFGPDNLPTKVVVVA